MISLNVVLAPRVATSILLRLDWAAVTVADALLEVEERLRHLEGRLAVENPAGINTTLTVALGEVRCVTDETARFRKFTLMVHGRQLVARSKRNELIAMASEERV
jgi:hypothetical protein